jgi:hypothetical protein
MSTSTGRRGASAPVSFGNRNDPIAACMGDADMTTSRGDIETRRWTPRPLLQ